MSLLFNKIFMKANKTHISLETAKLLKDCGVESEYIFQQSIGGCYSDGRYEKEGGFAFLPREKAQLKLEYSYPAYTWQEILWEYAELFFGSLVTNDRNLSFEETLKLEEGAITKWEVRDKHEHIILNFLQQKKYKEVDKYFRENCILINKQ